MERDMMLSLYEREEAVPPDAKRFILLSLENTKTVRPQPPIHTREFASDEERQVAMALLPLEPEPVVFWDFLSDNLKQDRDIALAAFVNGHARLEDLPERWNQDRHFFLDAIAKESTYWYDLPEDYQTDEECIRKIQQFKNDKLVAAIFQKIPTLRNDKRIWDTVISSEKCSAEFAPIVVQSDRELMMKACSKDIEALKYLDESLAFDKDFLQEVIDMNIEALCHLSHDSQRRFLELLMDNLPRWFSEQGACHTHLLYDVAQDVRHSPLFVKAWFTLGGIFSIEHFPESMRDSEQIFLWIAEHAHGAGSYHSFKYASDRLKGDIEFMLKAVEHNPNLFWHASNELKRDFLLILKSLAGSTSFARSYVTARREHDENRGENRGQRRIQAICRALQEQLDVHETFMMTTLLGISLPDDPSCCPLTVLNQGPETSLVYKKQIAEFAGVPIGDALWLVRRALCNLWLAVNVDQGDGNNSEVENEVENAEGAVEEAQYEAGN